MYRLIPTPTISIISILCLALLIFLILRLVKNIREKRWGRIAAFVISTVLVFGSIFLYGEYLLYKQRPKDLAFVEEVIKPAVLFTRKFYEENGVLPAEEDFVHAGLKCAVRVYFYTEGKREIVRSLLAEYDIKDAHDIQEALKDLLGSTIKEMMEAEMEDHLGYEKSGRSDNDDYRNGYKSKTVKSSIGEVELEVPQDRKSTFEPQVVKKGQKDISDIDHKIISMYAKGMTTRQISDTIEDIYGFDVSEGFISDVTDTRH